MMISTLTQYSHAVHSHSTLSKVLLHSTLTQYAHEVLACSALTQYSYAVLSRGTLTQYIKQRSVTCVQLELIQSPQAVDMWEIRDPIMHIGRQHVEN